MAIGPNSKWRCNPGCDCLVAKRHGQQRCKYKAEMVRVGEHMPERMMRLLYRLDLYAGGDDVRPYGHYRNLIKEWMWRSE